jgi:two-component system, chemotaxis family, CheB/CheR fusion protein
VLDSELRVLVWNQRSEDLWGVRAEEVQGQHLLNLDIGLPVGQLLPELRAALGGADGRRSVSLEAINRRGRRIRVLVTCTPLVGADHDIRGVIAVTEEQQLEEAGA